MGLITKTKRINILIVLMGFVFTSFSQNLDVKNNSEEHSFNKMKWFQQAKIWYVYSLWIVFWIGGILEK